MVHNFILNDVGINFGHYYRVVKVHQDNMLDVMLLGSVRDISKFCRNDGRIYKRIYPQQLDFVVHIGVEYEK